MKITDSEVGIREIVLDPNETLTQLTIIKAMVARNLRSKRRIETFVEELFDSLEELLVEQRQLAASTAP